MLRFVCILLAISSAFATGSGRNYPNQDEPSIEEEWQKSMQEAVRRLYQDPEALQEHQEFMQKQQRDGLEIPDFNCDWDVAPGKNKEKATSVNAVRPNDIGVVAALGDSITAAFGLGADSAATLAQENRGESWTVGGNDDLDTVLTIPNIIRKFNPDVFGASWSRPPLSCTSGLECSQLNVAISGATNRGIPGQMNNLIEKMQEYDAEGLMDIENDWKLVSILIGGNDLCRYCLDSEANSPETYVANIREAVEALRASVSRVIVNVVVMFDITPIRDMETDAEEYPAFCRSAHNLACGCVLNPENDLRSVQMRYYELLDEWINVDGSYDQYDDFTVVVQPHMRDAKPAYTDEGYFDMSFFAPDCFHPSRKGHQALALVLWNTMMTPVPEKPFDVVLNPVPDYVCPTEDNPYIATRGNSGRIKKLSIFDEETKEDDAESDLREYKKKEERAFMKYQSFPQEMREHYEELVKKDIEKINDLEIPEWLCDEPVDDGSSPANVHELRPQDVNVVASFGDSITAGNGVGADTLPGVAIENRGDVWTVGGNGSLESHLTLPNILRKFNPSVTGWSWSRGSAVGERNDTHCAQGWNCAQLNVAQPGGTCRNMLPQAEEMTLRMQNDEKINFEEDWKVVSLFIGGNDLCAVCRRWDRYNPDQHVADIKAALDHLYDNVPRVLVNLIIMFDISPLIDMTSGDPIRDAICNTMHNQFCDCSKNVTTNAQLRDIQMGYWERLDKLVNIDGTYDQPDRDDFTVVIQPYMRDMKPFIFEDGTWDMTYFAPDCFHPSRLMHYSMAYGLWNTMMTPVPDKVFDYPEEEELEFICPSEERPYIFTNLNSALNKRWAPRPELFKDVIQAFNEIKHQPQHKASHHQHHQDKRVPGAVIGAILGAVFVATILLGVVVPQWRKYRSSKAKKSDNEKATSGFANPAFENNM